MPRIGQIIPEYLVPHVKTYINDNTQFVEEPVEASDVSVRFLYIFASDKGDPFTVKKMTGTTKFLDEYGTPNFDKYGQANLMPYVTLATGNATCWCLRVVDDEASHSNLYVTATADTAGEAFTVSYAQKSIENFKLGTSRNVYDALIEQAPADALFTIASNGPGKYGDSCKIRIVLDTASSKQQQIPMYSFEVIDNSTGTAIVKERFTVSFMPDSKRGAELKFADDVINDPETGSSYIRIYTNVAAFDKLYADYAKFVEDANAAAVSAGGESKFVVSAKESLDIISGYDISEPNGTAAEAFVVNGENAAEGAIKSFSSVNGISMTGGSDGKFDPEYVVPESTDEEGTTVAAHTITEEERKTAIYAAYKKVLDKSNKKIPAIYSKRRTPSEFILDANYPCSIKALLADLATERFDAQCILDAGTNIMTVADAIAYGANDYVNDELPGYAQFTDYIISKECQHYKTRDPFTNKIITVTYTYFLAQTLPTHIMTYGNHVPVTGERFATLTGHIANSMLPDIDADDNVKKDQLYALGVNFAETLADNTFVRAVQSTAQSSKVWTDLSEMNNVAVMLEMKRTLENFVSSKLYNFSEEEDRKLFTEDANRLFEDYPGYKLREYSVYFDMNEYEAQRSILHCYLSVVFRQLGKRGIIEIDINSRS